jgi:hypothetical protein
MNLFDPAFSKVIAEAIILITALVKIAKLMKPFAQELFKIDWQKLWTSTMPLRQRLVQELTMPKEYPFAKKASTFILALVFYALALDCFIDFVIDVLTIFFTHDVAFWKRIIGVMIAGVIFLMTRWCLVQAEKTRLGF